MKKKSILSRSIMTFTIMTILLLISGQTGVFASTVSITEWMYKGGNGEYIELTNIGDSEVDFTGWSYDDESRNPGVFDLSGFGIVAAGESVIFTEANTEAFRSDWHLDSSVKILGGVRNNIGRGDEINIYDNTDSLVDRLAYGDEDFSGTIRTNGTSGNPISIAALGANDVYQWEYSYVGDRHGSYMSDSYAVGNPGINPVPVPGALLLMGSGLLSLIGINRRKKAN
jgi:predicted extracellular nuclease